MSDLYERLVAAAHQGMTASVWAAEKPDAIAIHDPIGQRTFGEVNANANRIVRVLRAAGLKAGDGVAVMTSNRAEFVEALLATLRAGMRFTPVNWHLTADEVEYIINDCEAKALIAETRYPAALSAKTPHAVIKLSVGEDAEGFTPLARALEGVDGSNIEDPSLGTSMLYTSGTTGRPKGVFRKGAVLAVPEPGAPDDVQMCAGPAYHAAPLAFDIRIPMAMGVPVVFLDKWDSEGVLATIERHKVTRAHLVPIMFQRLLALPDEVKAKYDISSLRYIIHGAAPCPPEVKKAMIDWVGPIIHEYYAGSEGGAGFVITSEEWLAKPGTVGKLPGAQARSS